MIEGCRIVWALFRRWLHALRHGHRRETVVGPGGRRLTITCECKRVFYDEEFE